MRRATPAMSNLLRAIRRDIRVFISAVTLDFGSARTLVKRALELDDDLAIEPAYRIGDYAPHGC
jgi:hypothetical protein